MKDFPIEISKFDHGLMSRIYNAYDLLSDSSLLKSNLSKILDFDFTHYDEGDIYEIYNYLIKNYYLGEINIKSAFYRKIMWKKQQVTMFEIPLGKSRADMLSINGESIIYEIKTEIDTLDRLSEQIKNYHNYAEKVYVICNQSSYKKILNLVSNSTGIILYSRENSELKFHYRRAAEKSKEFNQKLQLNLISLAFLKKSVKIKQKNKLSYIEYLMSNTSINQTNKLFKDYLKDKYLNQCKFILENHELINDIDIQTFFKLNVSPQKIYMKR